MAVRMFRKIAFWGMALVVFGSFMSLGGANSAQARIPVASLQQGAAAPAEAAVAGSSIDAVDCTKVKELGIDRMMNLRASAIMVHCGFRPGGGTDSTGGQAIGDRLSTGPDAYGGTDVDVILPDGVSPHLTQSESFAWGNGSTIVVNYNDSRTAPSCYSGISWSSDSGATWHAGQPLCSSVHGTNEGDPIVVYNARLATWFAGDLTVGGDCGAGSTGGIGLWTSPNGQTWAAGACAHVGTYDDRQSMWVDNNPASPFYGRMYISWNNFALAGGRLFSTFSDNGTSWSVPVALDTTGFFIRDGQVTGSQNGDGTVFVSGHTESTTDTTYVYRSTDGGVSWTRLTVNTYTPAGSTTVAGCGFRAIAPIWRAPEWGQPAVSGQVGGQNVVHYVYAAAGGPGDLGDVMYVRSTDNGSTWSAPLRMNTDATTQPQWQPSLSASPGGAVMVTWYDRRNTTNGTNYQYWGRVSTDNGATWLADDTVSDVMITQPVQPDPNVQSCYAGDYNYQSMVGNTALITWTDGRGTGNNQDVQFDRAAAPIATATPSRTPTIPVTPTRTNTHTPTRTPTIPATPTRTITPTITDTPTPAACGNYVISSKATATIVPGTTDTGNHCDDCTSTIALPFPVSFYDQQFNTATVSSNGVLEFLSNNSSFTNICLPDITRDYAIFPHWDDQRTDTGFAGCAAYPNGCGIFTVVTGTVGSRTFAIEWQAVYFDNNAQVANYEVVFHEGSNTFDIIYGQVDQGGSSATVGAQRDSGSFYTQYECSTGGLTFGLHLHFVRPPCAGCVGDYTADRLNGVPMVQGTIDIGNHTDDGLTTIGLPFAYTFYDQTFTTASISTNGNLQFVSANSAFSNVCLPDPTMNYAIFPHWDDLRTDAQGGCSAYASGCGIFTSVTGSAPNRVFNIEWRAVYFSAVTQAVNFEVRLFEGVNYFEVIYGTNTQGGSSATVGSQMGTGAHYTPYSCNTGGLVAGTLLTFNLICRAVTPTPTSTVISTPTNTATNTPTNTPVPATPILDGHVNWQGRPAQPNALQVLPITLTLKLGAVERNYASQNTDQNGHFLSDVSGLANGTYNWRVKGPKYLANCGAVTLTGVPLTLAEMGLMRAGDANNDNIINIQDFNIVKTTFGKGNGDPGYDDRGDFTGDQIVNILDFNLQKQNFGTAGCNALLPLETR